MKILVKQNLPVVLILVAWFGLGISLFYYLHGNNLLKAMQYAFYLGEPPESSAFSSSYGKFGIFVFIPAVVKIMVNNLQMKFNPELGCRLLARELQNHIVVIGYTHLGKRLVDTFLSGDVLYSLVEEDMGLVRELLSKGEPVVVGDSREVKTLQDAGVPQADAVIIVKDDLSYAFIISKRVRDMNKRCLLIVRCFQDDMTEVLESLGVNMVISSSKSASNEILRCLKETKKIDARLQ